MPKRIESVPKFDQNVRVWSCPLVSPNGYGHIGDENVCGGNLREDCGGYVGSARNPLSIAIDDRLYFDRVVGLDFFSGIFQRALNEAPITGIGQI